MRSRSAWGRISVFLVSWCDDRGYRKELVIDPDDIFPTIVVHFLNEFERYMPTGECCRCVPFPPVPGESHLGMSNVTHRQARGLL